MKRFFVFLLSLTIAYAPAFTFASSIADSGWNITSSIVNGATTTFNATKNKIINGASVAVTGVAKITPTGPQVGKMILKTGISLAVTIALNELLNATDYVLDPENNAISYKPSATSSCAADGTDCPSSSYLWCAATQLGYKCFSSPSGVATYFNPPQYYTLLSISMIAPDRAKAYYKTNTDGTEFDNTFPAVVNPAYDPTKDDRKSIPVDVVGGQIVQDAQDQAPARDYTGQVANTVLAPNPPDQIVPPAELIGQLEGSAAYPSQTTATETTTTTNPDGTTNTDKKDITIPAACDWFPQACEWFGWTREEPVNDADTSVDAQKPSEFDTSVFSTNRFQVSRQCPVPEQHTLTLSGISTNFAFDLSPLCSVLDLARPALVACSFLYAAYIVIGAARNG